MAYPNMDYRMCESTLQEMHQVLNAMRDKGTRFLREMSEDERASFVNLFRACEDFLAESEAIYEELESDESDGQPDEAQEWHDFDPDC